MPCASTGPCKAAARPLHCRASTRASLCAMLAGTGASNKEPVFFENEIELKWEKGGSGLVFYKDDNFWKDHENKDFDAETADDLDVDMSVYYEANGGDKDMRELLQIRREELLREGKSHLIKDKEKLDFDAQLNPFHTKIQELKKQKRPLLKCSQEEKIKNIKFDHYTKGFGRRLLEKQGWKEGESVGQRSGLKEALDASGGKVPFDKTGLGFTGDKVDRESMTKQHRASVVKEKRDSPFFIGSKFDEDASRCDSLLRRYDPTMKYRKY